MEVKVLGARGSVNSVEAVMQKVRNFEDAHSSTVQIFRADRIFGELHLISAVERAQRAFGQGRNRSKHLGTEILLYCAAERQIKNAIELLGITTDTEEIAIVLVGEAPEDELLALLEFERSDDVLDGGKDIGAFDITDAEVGTVGKDRVIDIILERMALSELDR